MFELSSEEIINLILNRQKENAVAWDVARQKVNLCKKNKDKPAIEFWRKCCEKCSILSKEYEDLIKEITK